MTNHYRYDPTDPLLIDMAEKPFDLPIDINSVLDRDDVLVYTTEPMNEPFPAIGDVIIEL